MLKFKIHGIEVTADSAAEAFALISEASKAAQPARPTAAVKGWPLPAAVHSAPSPAQLPLDQIEAAASAGGGHIQTTLNFLRAVRSSGGNGLGTVAMMQVFGVNKPKALGSKTGLVNNVLKSLGYEQATTYVGQRTPAGKVFTAGPDLGEAIVACEVAIGEK